MKELVQKGDVHKGNDRDPMELELQMSVSLLMYNSVLYKSITCWQWLNYLSRHNLCWFYFKCWDKNIIKLPKLGVNLFFRSGWAWMLIITSPTFQMYVELYTFPTRLAYLYICNCHFLLNSESLSEEQFIFSLAFLHHQHSQALIYKSSQETFRCLN